MVVDIPDRCIVIALRSCWHRLKGASPEGAWRAQGLLPPVARWQPLYWRDDAIGSPLSQLAVFAPDISLSCPLYLSWYLYDLRTTKPWRLRCCFSLCSLFLVLSFGTPPPPSNTALSISLYPLSLSLHIFYGPGPSARLPDMNSCYCCLFWADKDSSHWCKFLLY